MRVAFLSFDFAEYCISLASALAADAEVLLLLPEREAQPFLGALDRRVDFEPFASPRLRQPLQQIAMIRHLVRRIRAFRPDIVHFQHGHLWFSSLGLPLLRGLPMVITIHDPVTHLGDREAQKTPQAVMDFGYGRADRVIVHTEHVRKVVIDRLGLREEVTHVIPHVVLGDGALLSDLPEETGSVLFFGRIWEYKGLEYLIRAEPLVSARIPEARFVIAGHGDNFDRYRALMVHPDRFTVRNEYHAGNSRADFFARASAVVLPYVEASQSGVLPIAYANSKPVVATTVGGLPEMVDDGRTGYLVPPRDERALADAIVKLLADEKLRHEMGRNARRKVDAECSPAVVARQILEVYRLAVTGQRVRSDRTEAAA
jgi:glycosyltransferase involved in cell wall biosynthesis